MKPLFICTHNACRSILGEAITREIADERIEVASAGSLKAGITTFLNQPFENMENSQLTGLLQLLTETA